MIKKKETFLYLWISLVTSATNSSSVPWVATEKYSLLAKPKQKKDIFQRISDSAAHPLLKSRLNCSRRPESQVAFDEHDLNCQVCINRHAELVGMMFISRYVRGLWTSFVSESSPLSVWFISFFLLLSFLMKQKKSKRRLTVDPIDFEPECDNMRSGQRMNQVIRIINWLL